MGSGLDQLYARGSIPIESSYAAMGLDFMSTMSLTPGDTAS